jgi:hypothetical protein
LHSSFSKPTLVLIPAFLSNLMPRPLIFGFGSRVPQNNLLIWYSINAFEQGGVFFSIEHGSRFT